MVGTVIAGAFVLAALCLAVRSMVRSKKHGKSLSCSGDCGHCEKNCH